MRGTKTHNPYERRKAWREGEGRDRALQDAADTADRDEIEEESNSRGANATAPFGRCRHMRPSQSLPPPSLPLPCW